MTDLPEHGLFPRRLPASYPETAGGVCPRPPSDDLTVGPRPYAVRNTSSLEIATGEGEAHAFVLYFEPGGEIGPHEACYGQLFLALSGQGWVAGGDGNRQTLATGEAAFISHGEIHSKGSETGLTALMVQVRDFTPLL